MSTNRRAQPGPIWTQPAPGTRKPRFTREQIAEIAIRIADDEGFEALSMRRIADELDAGTMTLYHYVRTKEDLIELIDDALMGEVLVHQRDLFRDWREALAAVARATYDVYRRHPWALNALRGARFGPNSLRHFEQSLAAMSSAPFDLAGRLDVLGIVDDYVYGYVFRTFEAAGNVDWSDGRPGANIVAFTQAQLATGQYPHLSAMIGDGEPMAQWTRVSRLMTNEERFERGLAALVDGLARSYARAPAGRAARRGRSSAGARRRR